MVNLFTEEVLLSVRPPRSGERSLITFANLLEALGEGHTFSLGGPEHGWADEPAYQDRIPR